MGSRRQARENALQALYQCDTLCDFSSSCVDWYFESFHEISSPSEKITDFDFAKKILNGVIENLDAIDSFISSCSQNWSMARMSQVDRNILRIGAFEICFLDDVPPNVSINEAIEVAKRYAADDSPMFINGILDRIATEVKAYNGMPEYIVQKVVNG